jgi:nucleotide-binding universal stress UspA family protein
MVFDTDLQWARDRDEIIERARTADVIHLHNYLDLNSTQFAPIDLKKLWLDGRPMVRHFHSAPDAVAQQMHTTAQAVADCPIPKLVIAQFHARYYPAAKLVPNIVFGDDPKLGLVLRTDPLRIGYAPTRFNSGRASRWDTKGYRETTKLLKDVVRKAAALNIDVRVDIIEQVSHAECLQRKSACHIVIDDLVTGSYHLNTLESLASGSVCLTHMDRATQQAVFDLTGRSDFPAISVGLEDAEVVLLDLACNRPLVSAMGEHARAWMRQHWAPKDMARHFLEAYAHVTTQPGQPFPRRSDSAPMVQDWMNIRIHDLVWANRHQRWPKIMPDWARALRGGIGKAIRSIGLKR